MSSKYQHITQLYQATLHDVTDKPSAWQAFLRTACRNYKLTFDEQVLVYAQRPDATAVLEIERWNRRFGRWVNRGSKGIAVFDEGNQRLKHYFDIADTHGSANSRPVPLWQMDERFEGEVIESLQNNFGELMNSSNLATALMSVARNMVEDNITDYLHELSLVREGSALEVLDDQSVKARYHIAVENSVAYMLLTRCGIDARQYYTDEDFQYAADFNTPQTTAVLGVSTRAIAEQCLSEISKTVLAFAKGMEMDALNGGQNDTEVHQRYSAMSAATRRNRTFANEQIISDTKSKYSERSNTHESTDLSARGRLPRPEPDAAARNAENPWQIRTATPPISKRTPPDTVHEHENVLDAERASGSHRRNGDGTSGTDRQTDGSSRGRDGGAESSRPNSMGAEDEQYPSSSGGDGGELNLRIKPLPSAEQQLNFLGEAEGEPSPAFSITDEMVDAILTSGSNRHNSILNIIAHFKKDYGLSEKSYFLRNEYGIGGKGFLFDNERVSVWFDENGIRIAAGDTALHNENARHISWFAAAGFVDRLLKQGQFASQEDLDKADDVELSVVASKLYFLNHERADKEQNSLLPSEAKEVEDVIGLLKEQHELENIADKLHAFASAYEADRSILRWHHHQPKEVLERITGLLRTPLVYTAEPIAITLQPSFITQDEIDKVIRYAQGGNTGFYIYEFFKEERTAKEKEAFLKESGRSFGAKVDGIDIKYSGKGLKCSRSKNLDENYATATVSYSNLVKRIDELLAADLFLTERDKAELYPQYLEEQAEKAARKAKEDFIDAMAKVEPAEKRNTLPQRLADFIEGLSPYAVEKSASKTNVDLNNFATIPQIEEALKSPIMTEGLAAALNSVGGWASGIFERNNGYNFSNELNALHPRQLMYQVGDTVHFNGAEHEIISFNDSGVQLLDPDFPLIPRDELREAFDHVVAADPKNDHLMRVVAAESIEEPTPPSEEVATLAPSADDVAQSAAPTSIGQSEPANALKHSVANFRITDDNLGHGGAKAKFRANMNAIKLLNDLAFERRDATDEEKEILSRYVGWGGLPQAFDPDNSSWANEYLELNAALSPGDWDSARASTPNAHYTSPIVIKAMYKALENMGFSHGHILEPSCGVGNFFGLLPDSMSGSKLSGVELDSVTGRIAQHLYPDANIEIQGFEKTAIPDNFYDVAIGNVPFGDYKLTDRRYDKLKLNIHDYFFAKTLDKVRPGGVVAFVTSKGTLDKTNPTFRKYLAQRAELVGAIRLPSNAFLANAGTEVTTDIIFLQKRDRMIDIEQTELRPDWVDLGKTADGIAVNSYFADNPHMMLGEMRYDRSMYGGVNETACHPHPNSGLAELLDEAVMHIKGEIPDHERDEDDLARDESSIPADPNVRNYCFTVVDDAIYYRIDSRMERAEVPATMDSRIKGMVELRDCVRRLIRLQSDGHPDEDIVAEQAQLNTLYDSFTAKYGLLHSRGNSMAFSQDDSYALLCSLEVLDKNDRFERKADMFSKRTIRPYVEITRVDTANEALMVSLSERATVDLPYMAGLCGKTEDEVIAALEGVMFLEPVSQTYITADEYLSGDVREKLKQAQRFVENEPQYAVNMQALEAVQPKDLPATDISVRLGATWLPPDVVEQFIYELLKTSDIGRQKIKVRYCELTGEWSISEKSVDRNNVQAISIYGTKEVNAYKLIENLLNLRDVRVFHPPDRDGKEELNKVETAAALAKQDLIAQHFSDWIWKDEERRERLCRIYNDRFNAIRLREYNGENLTFPGMNPEIKLDKQQVDSVARNLYSGNMLLAHCVGAGKTYAMIAAAMESRRVGLANKNMMVVPNHLVGQWSRAFMKLYPAANILVTTKKDFEKKNRKRFCARIATGDYDAVIIGHSQFEKIPMSLDRQWRMIKQQIDDITEAIERAQKENADKFTVKQKEKIKRRLEARLAKLHERGRKDNVIEFEDLGVDQLFIDEAHHYKNLFFATKMRNISGISQAEAQKSSDLFMKCQYLNERKPGRGAVFATGTPVSNSMVEMYTMQRYLQYEELVKRGLTHFDAWASTFGETVNVLELAPEGVGVRPKTKFANFYNLPELMSLYRLVADIQTADMLNLPVPKARYHNIVVQPSELQVEMVQGLAERAQAIRQGVDPKFDNMLKVTNDGRKLALDQRLMNPLLPDNPNSKSAVCVENVYDIWEKNKAERLTQIVFCDLSTPKNDGEFNVYDDIKQKLMAKGVPEEEIAFIHDAKTDVQKEKLFAKVRSGEVRVLMGSTKKLGEGTNVQDRLVAIHDLDCPWRPSDLEQRLGRGVRRDNMNDEIDVFRYVTERTFDAYMYQLIEAKQKFISQVMTSKTPVRIAADIDGIVLSYAEIKALATGDPLFIEHAQLALDVQKLSMLQASDKSAKWELERKINTDYPRTISALQEKIAGYKADIITRDKQPKTNDFPTMQIGKELYTDKKEAGSAILAMCKSVKSLQAAITLGEYRGFYMGLSFNTFENKYYLTLFGTATHSIELGQDIYGNITRIDNKIDGLEKMVQDADQHLTHTKQQLETAEEEVTRPFQYEEMLNEAKARYEYLTGELKLDERDPVVADCEPDERDLEEAEERNARTAGNRAFAGAR